VIKADAILAADLHIRPDTPVGRTDDYFAAQETKLNFIFDLSRKNECPILVAGDFGNKHQWPNWLLEWFIELSDGIEFLLVPGQHDLPNHKLDLLPRSGLGVLKADKTIKIIEKRIFCFPNNYYLIEPFPYGIELSHRPASKEKEKRMLAMAHQMVLENKPLWPGQKAPKGHQLLKKFPEYDLILTGDNHNAFTAEHKGRWLVNPGSMMRMTAAQEEHQPRVYLWWAKDNEIQSVYLPIKPNVISRTHIDMVIDRKSRMTALVNRVKDDVEIILSYKHNLASHFNKHKTHKRTEEKVWEAHG
jgi:DNA repair exonuclease SbcCD nuclease subunit